MICQVYRSNKKADTYLYIRAAEDTGDDSTAASEQNADASQRNDDFSAVPEALMAMLGKLEWVMEVDLSTRRELAQVDCATLIQQIEQNGYFLQLPPTLYRGI